MVPALAKSTLVEPARVDQPARPRARWRDLAPRVASALVMVPLGLATIFAGGLIWQVVLTALSMIAMLEWASICGARPPTPLARIAAVSLPIGWVCHLAAARWGGAAASLPAGLIADAAPFAVVALVAFWVIPTSRFVALGVAYVGFGWASLLILREGAGGLGLVLFVMLVVWGNDIGAYLAGRLLGGPRLAPALSPGKTWAGAAGGIVLGVAAGLCAIAALRSGAPHPRFAGASVQALVLALVAQAGDLLESALKRRFGKKDSGSFIPGHGGLLDRVDGLMGAASGAILLRLAAIGMYGADQWQHLGQ